ncbi:SMI1/KNR4 family protein [Planomonospora venezuelensis]|uniref:Knr4/Smi1-like domain-containing protein n=1 Tax=Planomonospora venezuelensis TaxID=1999 RepID=A0A841D689_PLAVE|nr:SMI1/KNR4 family protein [Planomonospora venezuelensis]MBB5965400.1 hypothetical protein [Planomonospora venezuelensis]GIN05170.1 hypothetical protein Pve01_68280 [Planomonospora venezuelensis]
MSVPGVPRYPWLELLLTVNRAVHEEHARSVASAPPESARLMAADPPPEWLGTPGAAEAEIVRHEERLGMRLPPSYREFLEVSDGWDETGAAAGPLLPVGGTGWLRELDPDLADTWSSSYEGLRIPDEDYFVYGQGQDTAALRTEYLRDTLRIGEYDDGTYLLNPHVTTPDGEWEAWYLAAWLPGAVRFRSFWDLMNRRLREYAETP